MINLYIQEFIAITRWLERTENTIVRGNFIYVNKTNLIKMLEKNNYETAQNKLKVWRDLHWIETDPNRLTSRIRINGKIKTLVKINVKIYKTLVELMPKNSKK